MKKTLLQIKAAFFIIIIFTATAVYAGDFQEGNTFFRNGDYQKAISSFEKTIQNDTSIDAMLALYYIGRSYEKLEEKTKAIDIYKEFLKKYPDKYLAESAVDRIKDLSPEENIDYKNIKYEEKLPDRKDVRSFKKYGFELEKEKYSYEDELNKKEETEVKKYQANIKKELKKLTSIKRSPRIRKEETEQHKKEKKVPSKKLPEKKTVSVSGHPIRYTVKKNDTLFHIAKKMYNNGFLYSKIAEYNSLDNAKDLQPGQVLLIPSIDKKGIKTKNKQPKKKEIIQLPLIKEEKKKNVDYLEKLLPPKRVEEIKVSSDFNKAENLFRKKLYQDAIAYYKKIANNSISEKETAIAYFRIPQIHHLLKMYIDAVSGYNEFLNKFPNHEYTDKVKFNLANIYFEELGLTVKAEELYKEILKTTDDSSLASMIEKQLGKLETYSLQMKKDDDVIPHIQERLTKMAEIHPESKKVKFETKPPIPDLKEKLKKNKNDLLEFNLDTSDNNVLYSKPIIKENYEIKPVLPSEKKVFTPTVSRKNKPAEKYNDISEYLKKGYRYKNMGMFDEAINTYKKAIEIYPMNPVPYNNLAYLYLELNTKLDEAIKMVEKAINIDPYNKGFYLDTLGWAYYKKGNFIKAKEILEQAIFFSPTILRKYHLGKVYLALNMKKEALNEFKEAIILNPVGKLSDKLKNEVKLLE